MTAQFATRPTLAPLGGADRPRRFRSLANAATAGAVALSLILGAAVPVQAGGKNDLAKALIAALILGAIVSSVDKGHSAPAPGPHPYPQPAPHPYPQPAPHHPRVPAVCAIDIGVTGHGQGRRVFSESCLHREGFSYALPQRCASEARIYGRWDRIYGAQCLRDAGFKVSGR